MSEVKPYFVYGTLLQGFQNHETFISGKCEKIINGYVSNVYLRHFKQGYPGMYRVNDAKDNNQRVVGEIIFPKKECYLDLRTSLDGLEAYYGPNNPHNMYERKEMNAMDEVGNIYGCITYICLLNESDGLIFGKDSFDWKNFMKSKGLRDAAEDWAEK